MLKQHPFPVNEENFSQCWEYVDRQRRKARVKAATAKHGGFLVNQFFLLALLYLANGLIYTHTTGSYRRFLKTLPGFLDLWEKLAEHLLQPGASLWQDAIKLILLTYLASIALFALVSALIWLVYHPRKKAVPTMGYGENAALLVKQSQEARDYSYQTRIVTFRVALVFTIFCALGLFFAYALYIKNPNTIVALLTTYPTSNQTTNALLYVLAAYFVIDWLTTPLLWITRIFYRFDFPYDLVVQAEAAALLAREEFVNLSPEALAEKAAAIREEGLALEKQDGYHPAKEKLHQAALLGDVSAMEHYARHCLLQHMRDSARYWLDKCAANGNASQEALRMRRRMKLRMRHNVEYLKAEGNLTRKQKHLRALGSFALKLLSLILVLVLTAAVGLGAAKYFAPEGTELSLPGFLQELVDKWDAGKPEETEAAVSQTLPVQNHTMTLTETGTKWEGGCIAYTEDGSPVVYSYSKAEGGELRIPYQLEEGTKLRFIGVYVGNIWDVRGILHQASYQAPELIISEDFFAKREPGECFITLEVANAGGYLLADQYIPLIITE